MYKYYTMGMTTGRVWASTVGCKKGKVNVMDSLYDVAPVRLVKQIATLLQSNTSTLTLQFTDVCKQGGLSECGVYSIAYATALCSGVD